MRAKRSKQYRKLMSQYALTFGFREPFQVLIDSQLMQDAERFKMDLVLMLERTLHGKVKPMITQCSIRHLYTAENKSDALIEVAKSFERRRCNHHLLEKPLSTLECLTSVVDSKDSKINKHKYVIASQDDRVRAAMRQIPGVPLIYVKKSVMILEPMAGATEDLRNREERMKFKAGISKKRGSTSVIGKRVREDENENENGAVEVHEHKEARERPRKKGPKGPNPLSVRKPKPRVVPTTSTAGESNRDANGEEAPKKKRKRKHKPKVDGEADAMAVEVAPEG